MAKRSPTSRCCAASAARCSEGSLNEMPKWARTTRPTRAPTSMMVRIATPAKISPCGSKRETIMINFLTRAGFPGSEPGHTTSGGGASAHARAFRDGRAFIVRSARTILMKGIGALHDRRHREMIVRHVLAQLGIGNRRRRRLHHACPVGAGGEQRDHEYGEGGTHGSENARRGCFVPDAHAAKFRQHVVAGFQTILTGRPICH